MRYLVLVWNHVGERWNVVWWGGSKIQAGTQFRRAQRKADSDDVRLVEVNELDKWTPYS